MATLPLWCKYTFKSSKLGIYWGHLKISICGNFKYPKTASAEGSELFSCLHVIKDCNIVSSYKMNALKLALDADVHLWISGYNKTRPVARAGHSLIKKIIIKNKKN